MILGELVNGLMSELKRHIIEEVPPEITAYVHDVVEGKVPQFPEVSDVEMHAAYITIHKPLGDGREEIIDVYFQDGHPSRIVYRGTDDISHLLY